MILGIAEDFSTNVELDSELSSIPESGIYANYGVHPSITVGNFLAFLPSNSIVPSAWDYTKTYSAYKTARSKNALCTKTNVMYQSLKDNNINQNPATQTAYWLPTNAESLKLKSFLAKVEDKVYADLGLERRLINNQFLYEVGEEEVTLQDNFNGWVFEAKGSDYVTIRLNSVSFQKRGTDSVNLYVLNQGKLIDTLVITPSDGIVDFKDLGYEFSGTGKWMFLIDSTTVISNNSLVDPLNYDGFVCYTCSGIGEDVESATYTYKTTSNGLGFNVSVYADPKKYVDNNPNEFAPLVRATFEYMAFQMMLHNSFNRSDMEQRIQMNDQLLKFETIDTTPSNNSSINRYMKELRKAKDILDRTFDTQLSQEDEGIQVDISSI